jgi:hypothetical protein
VQRRSENRLGTRPRLRYESAGGLAGRTLGVRSVCASRIFTVSNMSSQPLGVECQCGRRVLLCHEQLGGCRGNMKELRHLKEQLKCLGCGQRPKDLRIFSTAEQARAFELEQDQPGPRF